MKIRTTIILSFVFLAGLVIPLSAFAEGLWIESKQSQTLPEMTLPSFAPIIEKLGKAVVNISVEGKAPEKKELSLNGEGPFELPLPPELQRKGRPTASLGSGFVIHPDGYIVTNNHVVDGADKIKVTFKDDKKTYYAKAIGKDPKTDLALLKVDAGKQLDAVVVGDSEKMRPGDWVIAIGNPFNFGHTATVGIVSAKSRRNISLSQYDDFIQTDASINPGNSGGPLFNAAGEVIGVNTAILSPPSLMSSGFSVGIGFAIPINIVKDIISQLHTKGKVVRGWLGVLIQAVQEDMADAFQLDEASGALVAKVMANSPAELAGIKRGDVIVKFDGKKVEANDELPMMVARATLGKEVEVEVIRGGKKHTLKATITELKDIAEEEDEADSSENKLGLAVQDITPEIARSLGLDADNKGVVVAGVEPESEAEKKGLRRGDVILEVDSQEVKSSQEFRQILTKAKKNKPILLLVSSKGNTRFVTLKSSDKAD
jgi:serine protease Do